MSQALALVRVFAAPPGVPAERVAALRRAFAAAVEDPLLLSEARSMNAEIMNPMDGETVEELVRQLLDLPMSQVEILRKAWQ